MAVDYSFPPWQQGNPGVEIPATLQRSRQLRQQQAVQAQNMAMQAAEWKQKQAQYQQQAQVLAQRALQEQEYQKTMDGIIKATQLQPGQPGYLSPQQIATATALANLKLGQGGSAGTAADMRALMPVPTMTPQPVNLPGQPPPAAPSAGFTGQLNSILQSAGKPGGIASRPGTPPQTIGQNIGGKFYTNKALGVGQAPPAPPTSVRELPVLRDDGTPDPTQFAIAGPKGVVVKSRPTPAKAAAEGVMTAQQRARLSDVRKQRDQLQTVLNDPEKYLMLSKDDADQKEKQLEKLNSELEKLEGVESGETETKGANEVIRQTKDGKKAVFDSKTRAFLRYAE